MGVDVKKLLGTELAASAVKNGLSLAEQLHVMAERGEIDNGFIPKASDRDGYSALAALAGEQGITLFGNNSSTLKEVTDVGKNMLPMVLEAIADDFLGLMATTPSDNVIYTSDIMFPSLANRVIVTGRNLPTTNNMLLQLSDIVAGQVSVKGNSMKKLAFTKTPDTDGLARTAEGAYAPSYDVGYSDYEVFNYKYAATLNISYEAEADEPFDTIALKFARLLWNFNHQTLIRSALEVALNGDGGANPAINTSAGGAFTPQVFDEWGIDIAGNYAKSLSLGIAEAATVKELNALKYSPNTTYGTMTPDKIAQWQNSPATPSGMPLKIAPAGISGFTDKVLAWERGTGGLILMRRRGLSVTMEKEKNTRKQVTSYTTSRTVGFAKDEADDFFTLTK